MKRYDGILLCSDFDLTLTSDTYKYRDGDDFFAAIPKNNIAAVNEFVNNGGVRGGFGQKPGRDRAA